MPMGIVKDQWGFKISLTLSIKLAGTTAHLVPKISTLSIKKFFSLRRKMIN
jgi:hypothetical protein